MDRPESIFVLRNNDIGDLLAVTPLFAALKKTFPLTKVIAGIGGWNFEILKGNPNVDEILTISAPWHNKQTARHSPNTLPGLVESMKYIAFSAEARQLKRRRCTAGIDVLGSPQGSLLMLRASIKRRLGVRGYAGGHRLCHAYVQYNSGEHVGRTAIRFAELLGARNLPEVRPQIFLTNEETTQAEECWQTNCTGTALRRVVIAPGAGLEEKRWPAARFAALAGALEKRSTICLVGGKHDCAITGEIVATAPRSLNLAGKLSLRETFALTSRADIVICNSSMVMHAAAAFRKRTMVLLGDSFQDAEQHAIQWGYPGEFLVLGKGRGRREIYAAEEVLHTLRASGWLE